MRTDSTDPKQVATDEIHSMRITAFRIGTSILVLNCIWSPICYHLYRSSWSGTYNTVLYGFVTTLIATAMSMCGYGWKRFPIAVIAAFDLLFWWFFGMMAGWP